MSYQLLFLRKRIPLLVTCYLLFIVLIPVLVGAAGIVPCGGISEAGTDKAQCTFNDLVMLGNKIIDFLIFYFAVPFAVFLIMWAGFIFLFYSSSEGEITKAKGIFWNVLWGFLIAVGAFLAVKFLLTTLGAGQSFVGKLKG